MFGSLTDVGADDKQIGDDRLKQLIANQHCLEYGSARDAGGSQGLTAAESEHAGGVRPRTNRRSIRKLIVT